ncbi:hypothetical protein F5Y15DRAFT_400069 [Xylariaceae sp. FL0016]|nr:hypothetical protein F5Y15DRAFT_400069 [Xylariaceae sp. FL0016]
MASAPAAAANAFRTGTRQVFLPNHIVTLLRPRENLPPHFAVFRVPLTFNKMDLRDYLLHCYNVPTVAVRSQVHQRKPLKDPNVAGRWTRPRPIKLMTAELTQPFVWPARAEGAELETWSPALSQKRQKLEEAHEVRMKAMQKSGHFPLREKLEASPERKATQQESERLLAKGGWDNKRELDPRFKEKGLKNGKKNPRAVAKVADEEWEMK